MLHNGFYDVFAPMETPRLRIRKLGIGDAEDIFAFSQNPEVSRFVLWDAHRSIVDSRSMVRGALYMLTPWMEPDTCFLGVRA